MCAAASNASAPCCCRHPFEERQLARAVHPRRRRCTSETYPNKRTLSLGGARRRRASGGRRRARRRRVWSRCFVIPPRKNGIAGAEDQARVDLGRGRDDAVLEDVPRLVGERLEDLHVDLVDARAVVARARAAGTRRPRACAASARAGSARGRRRGASASTWFATRGPTIASSADGGIGMPSWSAASSVSSKVEPLSSACISTVDWRVSIRLTTKAGASSTSTPRLPSLRVTSQAVDERDVVGRRRARRPRRAAGRRPG